MLYLIIPGLPESMRCVILDYADRNLPFFAEYMDIRDFHYKTKNAWEPKGGEDRYDPHSKFVLNVTNDQVTAGCRIIHDVAGLAIRELLQEQGLPVGQVPPGSTEISRFGVSPNVLQDRGSTIANVKSIALALETYFSLFKVTTSYAVLISTLETMLIKFGVQIERLPHTAVTYHGEAVFHTVRIRARQAQPQLVAEAQEA